MSAVGLTHARRAAPHRMLPLGSCMLSGLRGSGQARSLATEVAGEGTPGPRPRPRPRRRCHHVVVPDPVVSLGDGHEAHPLFGPQRRLLVRAAHTNVFAWDEGERERVCGCLCVCVSEGGRVGGCTGWGWGQGRGRGGGWQDGGVALQRARAHRLKSGGRKSGRMPAAYPCRAAWRLCRRRRGSGPNTPPPASRASPRATGSTASRGASEGASECSHGVQAGG